MGVASVLSPLLAYRLLVPALHLPHQVQIICHGARIDRLLYDLAAHQLDLVLSDAPAEPTVKLRAVSYLLAECGVSILGTAKLAAAYRRGFPQSLDGAPFLVPSGHAALRRELDQWFDAEGIRPKVRGEIGPRGLLHVFGQGGAGVFAVPTLIEKELRRQYGVRLIGRLETVHERFYAISVESKLKHPAVFAICEAARRKRSEFQFSQALLGSPPAALFYGNPPSTTVRSRRRSCLQI